MQRAQVSTQAWVLMPTQWALCPLGHLHSPHAWLWDWPCKTCKPVLCRVVWLPRVSAASIPNTVSQTGEEKAGEAMFRPEAEDSCSISQMWVYSLTWEFWIENLIFFFAVEYKHSLSKLLQSHNNVTFQIRYIEMTLIIETLETETMLLFTDFSFLLGEIPGWMVWKYFAFHFFWCL